MEDCVMETVDEEDVIECTCILYTVKSNLITGGL